MKTLLKQAREQKGLTTRQVSETLQIDQALISKFENGLRKPTKDQLLALSQLLEIDYETLMVEWLKEKILEITAVSEFGLKALEAAKKEMSPDLPEAPTDQFQKLFNEMESLKAMLSGEKKKP